MESLRCKYCGGYINHRTMKCDYCDTQYRWDANDIIPILSVERTNLEPMVARAIVNDEVFYSMDPDEVKNMVIHKLATDLAGKIISKAKIFESRNPRSLQHEYRVVVKVEVEEEQLTANWLGKGSEEQYK